MYIVCVLVSNEIIKVIVTENEIATLKPGLKVLIASKAFNPSIQKI